MLAKLIGNVLAVTTVCVITGNGYAHAEIFITTARITQGELVIVGRVRRPREPNVEIKISPSKTVKWRALRLEDSGGLDQSFPPLALSRSPRGRIREMW